MNNREQKVKAWETILQKIESWRTPYVDLFTLYPTNNVFDLLYDPEANGNHDSVGSLLINCFSYYKIDLEKEKVGNSTKDEWETRLKKTFPSFLFGEEGLYYPNDDMYFECIDSILDHDQGIVYDYNSMKKYFEIEDDEQFKTKYEAETKLKVEDLKQYPENFVSILKESPIMLDNDALRQNIYDRVHALVQFLKEEDKEDETFPVPERAMLTDAEIDLILDLHHRVLDGEVKINTLAVPENLA